MCALPAMCLGTQARHLPKRCRHLQPPRHPGQRWTLPQQLHPGGRWLAPRPLYPRWRRQLLSQRLPPPQPRQRKMLQTARSPHGEPPAAAAAPSEGVAAPVPLPHAPVGSIGSIRLPRPNSPDWPACGTRACSLAQEGQLQGEEHCNAHIRTEGEGRVQAAPYRR